MPEMVTLHCYRHTLKSRSAISMGANMPGAAGGVDTTLADPLSREVADYDPLRVFPGEMDKRFTITFHRARHDGRYYLNDNNSRRISSQMAIPPTDILTMRISIY